MTSPIEVHCLTIKRFVFSRWLSHPPRIRLKEFRESGKFVLPKLQKIAEESNLPEDAQKASDFANMIGRFEKKIYDLELTRMISVQMAPQIRMIQNNDALMAEKIRTSINNTIPLWKNQMVLALTMFHSNEAMKAQSEVSEVTNELLEKNAETLHQGRVRCRKPISNLFPHWKKYVKFRTVGVHAVRQQKQNLKRLKGSSEKSFLKSKADLILRKHNIINKRVRTLLALSL